jgi:hypothetical protein
MIKNFQEVFSTTIDLVQSYPTPHAASVPILEAARRLQIQIDEAYPNAVVIDQIITIDWDWQQLEAFVTFEITSPKESNGKNI